MTETKTLAERKPSGGVWSRVQSPIARSKSVLACSAWQNRRGISVISALENAKYPDGPGVGPQWHISIAKRGKRPSHVFATLRAFGMFFAEEDNHHPGIARHFWLPVDPARRVDCECKTDEDTITEPDGYQWTNPKPGAGPCRGCEFESTPLSEPCPIHGNSHT